MESFKLESKTLDGKLLEATFLPEKGMNLISYKKDGIEIIDQSTKGQFDERFSGLGPLIGPHFHRRKPWLVTPVKDETLFPHIAKAREKGSSDPFSHGVGRYAPWKVENTGTGFKAVLTGKDEWNGVPLAVLEGQNFKMEFIGKLKENGLHLQLSIVSDTDSLVGIHYYYSLPNGRGKVTSKVKNQIRNSSRELLDLPPEWSYDEQHQLVFDLKNEADFTFRSYPDPLKTTILLETETYSLRTHYSCECEENSWQLYHPVNGSFVCIEPISAQDPAHPNLSVSSIHIQLEIL